MGDAAYNEYMHSAKWRAFRAAVIASCKGKCERCQRRTRKFEVHHLSYERFGHELRSDVQALCPRCHIEVDPERRAYSKEFRRKLQKQARYRPVAEKKVWKTISELRGKCQLR